VNGIDYTRRRVSAALACIGAIALLAGVPLVYAGHVLANSDQFATRGTSVLADPSIRRLIADQIVVQLESGRSVSAISPLIDKVVVTAVNVVVGSAPFHAIFRASVLDLHRSVFVRDSDTVTLRLAHIGGLVAGALRTVSPALAALVPTAAVTRIAGGNFGAATRAARGVERAHAVGIVLVLAAVVVFALAIAQADERWRAAAVIGIAVAVAGGLLIAAETVARPVVLAQFVSGEDRTAAGAVWDAFLPGLRTWALGLAAAGAVMAAISAAAAGARGRARRGRRRSPSGRADPGRTARRESR
jgi:hypothetical protein